MNGFWVFLALVLLWVGTGAFIVRFENTKPRETKELTVHFTDNTEEDFNV